MKKTIVTFAALMMMAGGVTAYAQQPETTPESTEQTTPQEPQKEEKSDEKSDEASQGCEQGDAGSAKTE